MNGKELFMGKPRRNWRPVILFVIMCGLLWAALSAALPHPWHLLAYTWVIVGRGLLTNHKAISKPYPETVAGSVLSFAMAAAWPYFCHLRNR